MSQERGLFHLRVNSHPLISSPLTVPTLFAAVALLAALLAAAQPQRAPPGSGRAPHPTDRHVQGMQQEEPAKEEGDLQLLLYRLHHHQQ